MAPRVIITKGLPASGKSTWAKEQVKKGKGQVKRVNKDDLRAMLDCGLDFSSANERFILEARDSIIRNAIRKNRHIIVDDTNLNPIHEKHIRRLVGPMVKVEVRDFTMVEVEECIRRDAKRLENPNEVGVGEAVIRKMAKDWEKWKEVDCSVTFDEPGQYERNPDLPDAIIVDIDGTLAHVNGRSYYDYSKVSTDVVDEKIKDLVCRLAQDYQVVIVSGRDYLCYEDTAKWLAANGIPHNLILMRTDDDKRHDYIVKRELYENHIKDLYNVHLVLDDRNQCIDLWRNDLGFKTLQVANGDF